MPSQASDQQPPSPFGFVMGVIQKGGKAAAICAFVCGIGLIGLGITSMISFHSVLAGATTFFQGVFCFGAGFGIASLSFHANRTTQMIAVVSAEDKIESPHLTATSADPAVQREIEKQLAAPDGARPTPLDGVPKPEI